MERSEVTLAFHIHVFHFPLDIELITCQPCVRVEPHGVSEVIQGQIFDLESVAFCLRHAKLIRRRNVIELSQMTCGHRFIAISQEMPIEVHEETDEGQVVRRDHVLVLARVFVAE